jgi:hypothetical protein
MRRLTATLAVLTGGLLCATGALAQFGRGSGEWNTTGGDAHRSFAAPPDHDSAGPVITVVASAMTTIMA